MAPRAWLIENPTAGQSDQSDWTTQIQAAGATFREAGWEVLQRPTEKAGDATEFAREAVSQQADFVIVAGGDGTVNCGRGYQPRAASLELGYGGGRGW